jgi:hypothetical protein
MGLDSDEANPDYKDLRSADEVVSNASRTPRKTPRDL